MIHENQKNAIRVCLISLGCAKNLVDSELMLGRVLSDQMEITTDIGDADALIINTCSFINDAKEESIDTILESAYTRETVNPELAIVVAGCLPQRYTTELLELMPEVDAFMGINEVQDVDECIKNAITHRRRVMESATTATKGEASTSVVRNSGKRREASGNKSRTNKPQPLSTATAYSKITRHPDYVHDHTAPRLRLTPSHLTYVKIAEGCNHPCSFCSIPRIRGRHRSRPLKDIACEVRNLIAEGVREINLISQDTTNYGADLVQRRIHNVEATAPAPALAGLIEELDSIPGDFWVRILYTHPAHWTDSLIHAIKRSEKTARYIDIPLQHIHPVMLERMRRETSREHIERLLRKIREAIPGITIRTTFIVGFPGETDAHFESLLEFIEESRFERLGVFTYSPEEGTRAAKMSGQIPEDVKADRLHRVMSVQRRISSEILSGSVGKTIRALVEEQAHADEIRAFNTFDNEHGLVRSAENDIPGLDTDQVSIARGESDAPDIDGRVIIKGALEPGKFAKVKIVGHSDYDLIAIPEKTV
ncbi:MAG: 30S ribosomal protein S12 methylthiotransferase RimO [Verrucomicrobia bacterium]|nr:30S ribosomal protein S12 methylthiotransferase RimO [Verrucomicrobiota bacterium]MCF7707440.1 30S ribosomal protein S12 methylthiotransferase RimO [Verrucomicrobiota bacterium]